jgi:hypothetical protein
MYSRRVRALQLLRCSVLDCERTLGGFHIRALHHGQLQFFRLPQCSFPATSVERSGRSTIKSSAQALLLVSLAGWVLWTTESNSCSSNEYLEEHSASSELFTKTENREHGSPVIENEEPLVSKDYFAYPTLAEACTTRLLILEPGSFQEDLKCQLKCVTQLDEHQYEALSYFWGKAPGTIIESSSGKRIQITANCEAALRRIRHGTEPRFLWVDAICTDQSNDNERSRQVEIMQKIYTGAKRVIIWLGETSAQDSLALSSLKHLRKQVDTLNHLRLSARLGWFRDKTSEKVFSGGAYKSIVREAAYEHLGNLLRREWFRRTWVIQEVASAKDAIVIYGNESMKWETFAEVYMRLGDVTQLGGEDAKHSLENISAIENARRSRSGPLFMPLFYILVATSFSQCSDPRDKIYAVKGLAKDWEDRKGLETNYKISVETLFRTFAVADSNRNLNLRTLSCASGPTKSKNTPLPSWVPDWRSTENAHPFVRYSDRTKFRASGGMKAEAWHSHYQSILHVRGKLIDSVAVLGSKPAFTKSSAVFEINTDKITELSKSATWLQECEELASNRDGILKSGRQEQLWRTLTCGLTGDGFPAPQHYAEYFWKYMKFMAGSQERFTNYLAEAENSPNGVRGLTEAMHGFETHKYIEASIDRWSSKRRFCITNSGALACVPKATRHGDIICVLFGGEVPYVLRPTGTGRFLVVGECYVHGIMKGESLSHDTEIREFQLV